MAKTRQTYHSRLYREFRAIPPNDHRARVHYFENHEDEIRGLYPEEVFEFVAAYALALYEINDYRRFLVMVEEVLIRSINDNFLDFQGEDVYERMLFRKSIAHLNLREMKACQHTLTELLRMSPTKPEYVKILGKCWYFQKPAWVKTTRAISVAIFIAAALVTAFEVLFITPFTPGWTDDIQLIRNSLFVLGICGLVLSETMHRLLIQHKLGEYRRDAEERKRRKRLHQS
ncbi:MAG: hypothetical protein GYB31_06300 [Bacteroidetes bacterium]|nr:hypothetical protein [Bacteroidota bacterium]